MESELTSRGLGRGIYSVEQASLLTGVSSPRIRRWFKGYAYHTPGGTRSSPPVLVSDYGELDGRLQLSFLDMVEARFIGAFLGFGVGWKELRIAARNAAELLSNSHPFSTLKFRTDGRRIFARMTEPTSDAFLLQLRDRQQVFRQVVEPLLHGLEFDAEAVRKWWPLGERRRVVIDPARSFGQPVTVASGVPTGVLAPYALATSVAEAARWFEADRREVRDAIEFEARLAA